MNLSEQIRAKLTPEEYEALLVWLRAEVARRGRQSWIALLRGALRSWTVWFGGVLIMLPEAIELLAPHLEQSLTAEQFRIWSQVAGVIVILIRLKTTQSLTVKGQGD